MTVIIKQSFVYQSTHVHIQSPVLLLFSLFLPPSLSLHSMFSLSVSVFSKTNQNVQSKQTIYSFVIRGSNFMTFVNLVKHTRAIICIFPTFEFVLVLVLVLLYCESKFLTMLYNKTSINCCFVGFQGQHNIFMFISAKY